MNAIFDAIIEFKIFCSIMGIIIYTAGVLIDCSTCTICDIKFHKGGFLNSGYTTHSNRELLPKDVRFALLWPIRIVIHFILETLGIIHEFLFVPLLLLFNIRYKRSKIYKRIDNFLWR